MNLATVRALVCHHEGLRLFPYYDSKGKLTIGYGRNLSDRGISQSTADEWLNDDLADCHDALERYVWFDALSDARQHALMDLMFNVGHEGFRKFVKLIAAIERRDFTAAADEILNSEVAPLRARDLAMLMRKG